MIDNVKVPKRCLPHWTLPPNEWKKLKFDATAVIPGDTGFGGLTRDSRV